MVFYNVFCPASVQNKIRAQSQGNAPATRPTGHFDWVDLHYGIVFGPALAQLRNSQ